jgi:hypothetical protein
LGFAASASASFRNAGKIPEILVVEAAALLVPALLALFSRANFALAAGWTVIAAIQLSRFLSSLRQEPYAITDEMGRRTLVVPGGFSLGALAICAVAAVGLALYIVGRLNSHPD